MVLAPVFRLREIPNTILISSLYASKSVERKFFASWCSFNSFRAQKVDLALRRFWKLYTTLIVWPWMHYFNILGTIFCVNPKIHQISNLFMQNWFAMQWVIVVRRPIRNSSANTMAVFNVGVTKLFSPTALLWKRDAQGGPQLVKCCEYINKLSISVLELATRQSLWFIMFFWQFLAWYKTCLSSFY